MNVETLRSKSETSDTESAEVVYITSAW
jgi:hypothetical protein